MAAGAEAVATPAAAAQTASGAAVRDGVASEVAQWEVLAAMVELIARKDRRIGAVRVLVQA